MLTRTLRHRITQGTNGLKVLLAVLLVFVASYAGAQTIRIGGGVYGGARQADVGGHTFVHIGADNHDVIINAVYGGNDIAGKIGDSKTAETTVPAEFPVAEVTENEIDNDCDAFILTEKEATGKHIFIGQLFGGGNGDYPNTDLGNGKYNVTIKETEWDPTANSNAGGFVEKNKELLNKDKPELAKTYVDLHGGTFGYAYGGGNNVTVTERTDICINNKSDIWDINGSDGDVNTTTTDDVLSDAELLAMGINTVYFDQNKHFHFSRVFGGNNKAIMNGRPFWHLKEGKIENLYSGGNEGAMTHEHGLLLEIQESSNIFVDNVFGGCRKADVHPKLADGQDAPPSTVDLTEEVENPLTHEMERKYKFPQGLAARVLIRGGDINNVYGGNDVAGRVYGGNAVGVYHSIRGNLYGGGNGSYAYTDNYNLKDDLKWGDFCYNRDSQHLITTEAASIDALNAFRPNAEQVSIRVYGKDEANRTIIGGSIYVGGNSATLQIDPEKLKYPDTYKNYPLVELKVGSYATATEVFLGNNGKDMIDATDNGVLAKYAGSVTDVNNTSRDFSMLDLTKSAIFDKYMQGVVMDIKPRLVFDKISNGDPKDYLDFTTKFGSLYLGGNVGSMAYEGTNRAVLDAKVIIFDKIVAGCNDANVPERPGLNARYEGGILGSSSEATYTDNGLATGNIKDRIILTLDGPQLQPKRWNSDRTVLDWNTVKWVTHENAKAEYAEVTPTDGTPAYQRRLDGGNVYGGCHNSGHVNGNVVINILDDLVVKDDVFASPEMVTDPKTGKLVPKETNDHQTIDTSKPLNSGVLCFEQGVDVLGTTLNVFGAGYGADSEIWGSTTINLQKGYTFQVFGGGMQGVVGKKVNGNYSYDSRYSTYINLCGETAGSENGTDLAEAEYIYGGGYEGSVCGDTHVNLGNGRVYDAIAGACNADIYGHTELYVGGNGEWDNVNKQYVAYGFPYVRDNVYGGNDFGGRIGYDANHAYKDYSDRIKPARLDKVFTVSGQNMLTSQTYVAYIQGRVDSIFGGNYGEYHYADPLYRVKYTTSTGAPVEGFHKPQIDNSFVNFQPLDKAANEVNIIFGGSQGNAGEKSNNNSMQKRSYVFVDDALTSDRERFAQTDIYGGGAYGGVGDRTTAGGGMTAIDLFQGRFHNVYGGSNREGLIGYARINVPETSTIQVNALFGGGKGYDETTNPGFDHSAFCDTYVTCIDYRSATATVENAIYGGNHNCRIACDTYINLIQPVKNRAGELVDVYGAGYGAETVSGRTNVFLNNGAKARYVYGGGLGGNAYNFASLTAWLRSQLEHEHNPNTTEGAAAINAGVTEYAGYLNGFDSYLSANSAAIKLPTEMGTYKMNGVYDGTFVNNIRHADSRFPDLLDYYNTNVRIFRGAEVRGNPQTTGGTWGGYVYGGGEGLDAVVSGTTHVELLGGWVEKDIYGGGYGGPVMNEFGITGNQDGAFVASTNVDIVGGRCRNVYGGGWEGAVGKHTGNLEASYATDIPAETHVTIGILEEKIPSTTALADRYYQGVPVVERNAYGGGEGGPVWGTSNITMNNGYVGYAYNATSASYEEKIIDNTLTDSHGNFVPNTNLYDSGCIFGGGYIDNSNVDVTNVLMYGGQVRNALFGGGEIAAIGRGKINASGEDNSIRALAGIYKAGKTNVDLFDGHVHRNVFGGGRGYNNLGEGGHLYSDGYVFGQTEVHIHGGEIGTTEELANENGNVFGGGDIGYVYSAYEKANGSLCVGKKSGVRYDNGDEGYYYKNEGGAFVDGVYNGTFVTEGTEKVPTEDCKVLIEPHCKVTASGGISFTKIHYPKGHVVSSIDLKWLKDNLSSFANDVDETTGKVKKTGGITFSRSYNKGDYVPMAALNTLANKNGDSEKWGKLDISGIIIHNAIFAGGNTSSGSSKAYANATSVFGNATASVYDAYHRDLITVGTGHIGGLYGDGNLTFVDGYRGLNITNYGTDYYTISSDPEISIEKYRTLDAREAAYYQLTYKCVTACTDDDGTSYHTGVNDGFSKASSLTADDILTLFKKQSNIVNNGTINAAYWKENGVCTIYAGRLMNTIQRADFCGVFGSRMVMQGAQDRVPETVDYKNYTINRVREVSLNQQHSVIDGDLTLKSGKQQVTNFPQDQNPEDFLVLDNAVHGNYFGIYNVVNYLGALSSDVHFSDIRRTDNASNSQYKDPISLDGNSYEYGSNNATYYNWKRAHKGNQKRNNGQSLNKVALASGVYLELTTEESTGDDLNEKVWGHVTGVIELDLINVQTGTGGGFVYAKNEHRTWTYNKKAHATLTALNADAITQKDFSYTHIPDGGTVPVDNDRVEWETSGNFVHSEQVIIDDCYNVSAKYEGSDAVPAHYWYIKGSVYVYDQYISAYTGVPNAFSESVDIPLTITAASHGTMKLLNVQPNLYAYYNTNGQKLGSEQKLIINDITYYLNSPISYWDWNKLTSSERALFKPQTYVTSAKCKIGDNIYPADYVMLPEEYQQLQTAATQTIDGKSVSRVQKVIQDANGNDVVATDENHDPIYLAFDKVFHLSNNLSHDTGYLLTYKVNNPVEWDTWYTEYNDDANNESAVREKSQNESALDVETNTAGKKIGPNDGPTYHLISDTGGLLGQMKYVQGNIIPEDVYTTYQAVIADHESAIPTNEDKKQATFERAWIVTQKIDDGAYHLNPGTTISATKAGGFSSGVAEAYVCTSTIQLTPTDFIYINSKMSGKDKNDYIDGVVKDIKEILTGKTNEQIKAITQISDLTTTEQAALTAEQKKTLNKLLLLKEEINKCIVPAYYCTSDGLYGGDYYESGVNYRGLAAWCSMSAEDRAQFEFNYDALDLLIDPTYSRAEGEKYQYDGPVADINSDNVINATDVTNPAGYSLTRFVDYTATYNGTSTTYNGHTLTKDQEYTRTEFEQLPNERRNYTPIKVDAAGTIYVVNSPSFLIGNTPYAVGSTISSTAFNNLSESDKEKITRFTFDSGDVGKTFYYCRESYIVGKNAETTDVQQVTNVKTGKKGSLTDETAVTFSTNPYGKDAEVPIGVMITEENYTHLPNKQENFTIHGKSPTEVSTLYVSRNSDINDLSTEKIITVIYQYDYEESDESAMHVTPISERHVVNIHIQFKTGAPIVEDISAPQIVIPGDFVGLREPHVKLGATEVTGGGWELFEKKTDAESHTNGIAYTPEEDPLFWYQDGYWLAYYAQSFIGGKTYSNAVQVSVANYHDLKKVMADTEHHYYVDYDPAKLHREPKIYIKDATNGASQLKDFIDLSYGHGPEGHTALNTAVQGGKKLEFFLNTNINHTGAWTPIANNNGECFSGTLHGDGHYISGLDHSLFNHLCGDVYNLGVKGTFASTGENTDADAGIAEEGEGYVENCWVYNSSTGAKTKKPVFGNPSREGDNLIQIVNCYYMEEDDATNKYTNHTGSHGIPTRKSSQAFYNGEVAYDLNGFYLYKRYADKQVSSGADYKYYTLNVDGDRSNPQTAHYGSAPALCSAGYVEDRFADGDFIYAGGFIPSSANERLYIDTETKKSNYYPIWPHDYIFFGQDLNFNYLTGRTHEDVPSPIVKVDDRIVADIEGNRVHRAPAYFRSGDMGVAHFNSYALFPQTDKNDPNKLAYKNMTAIDFTGYHDYSIEGFQLGWAQRTTSSSWWGTGSTQAAAGTFFYPPLLDDDGLIGFTNIDLTKNLLVYTGTTAPASAATDAVVSSKLPDPIYAELGTTETPSKYRAVAYTDPTDIVGHWVQLSGSSYTASRDHLLVDAQDFNAPISYTFNGKRMWYQRSPKNYVGQKDGTGSGYIDNRSGWEDISLPFSAELVTTNQKGEITHFYDGSYDYFDQNGPQKGTTGKKVGHEYWLRAYRDITTKTVEDEAEAIMTFPAHDDDDVEVVTTKPVTNTFLWDYYYNNEGSDGHNHLDKNKDTYQTYYSDTRNFADYPLLTQGTPYIIGFPGERYYEFDLSGNFDAETTDATKPEKISKAQTITFASVVGQTIEVSDTEMAGINVKGYVYKPNYLNTPLENVGANTYAMATDGGSYHKYDPAVVTAPVDVPVSAFRPYFVNVGTSQAKQRKVVGSIVFSDEASSFSYDDNDPKQNEVNGELIFYTQKLLVGVKSSLRSAADVQIVNTSGQNIGAFIIQPGETIETPVPDTGVYIVRAMGGKYNRKVTVK